MVLVLFDYESQIARLDFVQEIKLAGVSIGSGFLIFLFPEYAPLGARGNADATADMCTLFSSSLLLFFTFVYLLERNGC